MRSSGIGGQAVLEGVMMKNQNRYAVVVRKPDNQIEVKTEEYRSAGERIALFRLPIFRGMAAFAESLMLGIRTLTYSAGFSEGDEQQNEASRRRDAFADVGVAVLSVLLAVIVFILFPLFLSGLIGKITGSGTVQLLIEGVLRIAMFVVYVALISRVNEIKRVFMYHGAEHKCINCVEQGEELTVANVKHQSRRHRRCGTSFLLVVMLVSFVLFMLIRVRTVWLRYVLRIVLVPFIAGLSYEFIRLAGNSDSRLISLLGRPGLWLQGLTTREPDDSMIEIAILSVELVFDWNKYQEEAGIAKRRKRERRLSGGGNPDQRTTASSGSVNAGSGKEELSLLDRMSLEKAGRKNEGTPVPAALEGTAAGENHEVSKKKVQAGSGRNVMNSMNVSEEDDDEILRALDKFFSYKEEPAQEDQVFRRDVFFGSRAAGGRTSGHTAPGEGRASNAERAAGRGTASGKTSSAGGAASEGKRTS